MSGSIEVTWHEGPLVPEPVPAPDGAGAVIAFEGVIRGLEGEHAIEAIEYEVYQPMADLQMREMAQETLQRFTLIAVMVRHSFGRVPVGAVSFRLIVAAPHRAPAIEAMAWFIDTMKQDVPIWKRPITLAPHGGGA
ncbi:MAG: molybdenum cofactor biosynthesis protein MoaE [Phycisphaerales bacterium]